VVAVSLAGTIIVPSAALDCITAAVALGTGHDLQFTLVVAHYLVTPETAFYTQLCTAIRAVFVSMAERGVRM
jgi:hypothetical protein